MTIREFGPLEYDLGPLGANGLMFADGVLPLAKGYKPLRSLASSLEGVPARPISAYAAKSTDGTANNFVGTPTKLYRISSTNVTDVSKSGDYTDIGLNAWNFAVFGDSLIATNFVNEPQVFDLASGGVFSNLSATAPKAKYITTCNEFVMLANVDDSLDGEVKNRLWWSPINNPAGTWASSQATQSDYQDIPDGGAIQGLVGYRNFAYVFLENAVYRASYEGTPLIFRLDSVGQTPGCQIPGSVVAFNDLVYYFGYGAFWEFNGQRSRDISFGRVSKYFLEDCDFNMTHAMRGVVDEENNIIMWSYAGRGNNGIINNKLIMYNYIEERWSTATYECHALYTSQKPSTLLDDITASVDSLSISVDSANFKGGGRKPAAFDSNYKFGFFDGVTIPALLETGDIQPIEGRISFIEYVEPLIDGTPYLTISCAQKQKAHEAEVFTQELGPINDEGKVELYCVGRFHRFRFHITGDEWDDAKGYQFFFQDDGEI